MTTFGIIGAGHIGSTLAQVFIDMGHDVVVANSRDPETLAALVAKLGPKARAATASEAAAAADYAVVAIPANAINEVPVEPLAGKIVLDTVNYYWERDGRIDALDTGFATTSGLLQAHLPTSKVVKSFNHLMASEIVSDGFPAGPPNRRALAVASDYPEAVIFVADLYERLGFDAVDTSPLSESWRVERDRPAYVARQTKPELIANLAKAPRLV
jgi:predicted dinucleotide-binding enzyme